MTGHDEMLKRGVYPGRALVERNVADLEMHVQRDGYRHGQTDDEKDEDDDDDYASLLSHTADPLPTEEVDMTYQDGPGQLAQEAASASASWASMPNKGQLTLITLARLCETAANSSLQTYIVSQLRFFQDQNGTSPSGFTLAFQLSVLNAVVAGPQLFTSILWGRLADSRRMGRKRVMIIGLVGTGISSLGLGASKSFAAVAFWRFVAGLTNGNRGVMRTMIKDISGDRFESRAVLLLPTAFNVGSIVGPAIGGLLADPAGTFPGTFGPGSNLGGRAGVEWLIKWPFALPNIFNGLCLIFCAVLVAYGLEETLEGVTLSSLLLLPDWLKNLFRFGHQVQRYESLIDQDPELNKPTRHSEKNTQSEASSSRIWTPRLVATLVARWLMTVHVGAYPSLLLVFISTPRYNWAAASANTAVQRSNSDAKDTLFVPSGYAPHLPFIFTGGLSFRPGDIAAALTIRGIVGLLLQLLFFPLLKNRFGLIRLYHYSLLLFPIAYLATPYLAVIPSSSLPPLPASGAMLWAIIAVVLTLQTVARSFALPSSTMLLNAASPNKSTLGTVNGIGQSVSAAARVLGPLLTAWFYGVGVNGGMIGFPWWALAVIAVTAGLAGSWLKTVSKKGAGGK